MAMNMAELKEFDVIRVARSDGSDTGPGYWPVTTTNATTATKKTKDMATAAEKTPRTKPQMVRLAEDDPRFTEWKVKLGILLKQELCPNPDEGNPWLVNFPRGYWLYEKSKHLWVSGYPIKVKLFKSPQEFAVHLIWLLSTSMDYRDCCCAHCNAANILKGGVSADDGLIITHEPPKVDKMPPRVTPVPLPPMPGQAPQKPGNAVPRSVSAQSTPAATAQNSPAPTPISTAAATVQQFQQPPQARPQEHVIQPQPQPQPHPQQLQPQTQSHPHHQQPPPPQIQQAQTQPQVQQQIQQQPPYLAQAQQQPIQWSLRSSLLFRSGELVWYQNGSTWRLGVIASSSSNGQHEVMPIGHGAIKQNNVTKTDRDMRPFYAFTVPPVGLAELKEKAFDGVSWESLIQSAVDGNGRELIALDASKMAAVKIDYSYSLWSKHIEDPKSKTVTYYGCFFGAERVELGDAMRLKTLPAELNIPAETCVLGLLFIFTRKESPGAVFFRGHVYQLVPENHPNIVRDEHLPVALRNESQWRRSVGAQRWCYALVKENVVFKEQSIRGRFYPTHRLMPILNPTEFQNSIEHRRVDEQHAHLNNRMDGAGRYLGRKINRLDTLGASVAHTARISLESFIKEGDQPVE